MWYKNVDTAFFRFVTNHAFDRQTALNLGNLTTMAFLVE